MKRDYNCESRDNAGRKYAYQFDFDVMHPYMIKSFAPFFKHGEALELGCFQGAFTRRIAGCFEKITCVEASGEALRAAEQNLADYANIQFVESMFEDAVLPHKYQNIFLVHVLEHIDDRIGVLQKIRREWLADDGVLFVACPNANAPSRQIAVKMGLIAVDQYTPDLPLSYACFQFRQFRFHVIPLCMENYVCIAPFF